MGREEPDERDHQQAGVQFLGAVILGKGALGHIEPLVAHLVVDLLAYLSPLIDRALEVVLLGCLDGPVDGHPGHDFGVGEVTARTTHLPDAVVGLAPTIFHEVHERELELPC